MFLPHCERFLQLCYMICLFLIVLWLVLSPDVNEPTRLSLEEERLKLIDMVNQLKYQQTELSNLKVRLENKEKYFQRAEVRLRQKYGAYDIGRALNLNENMPTIFAITPTFARDEQKSELTRLSQTFLHVPNFHWIVIEDSKSKTQLVRNLLGRAGLNHTHLNLVSPQGQSPLSGDLQRNRGLRWIRETLGKSDVRGVVIFADDDNTYDLRIFEEMRYTKKVSVWPVAFVGGLRYERPIVIKGKVVGWQTEPAQDRRSSINVAAFAVNLRLILDKPQAQFQEKQGGYFSSAMLNQLVTQTELEPLANQCTKVFVWKSKAKNQKLQDGTKIKRYENMSHPYIEV
ncbi:galactosylgalactosylxylosylprotein 3-beta-glucuronosyltransferase 1-like [Liolophura sinensis]|uniref:galactosylgalactosylxylosylprotein 3-beta-glucuronosyltransferase 1-like n=1 Tax=Liolophura sinensis TaxID=3198878 RepID=UPI0031587C78